MAQFAPLGLTAPVTSPILATRSKYCANAPHTVAGTFLNARNIDPKSLTSSNDAYDNTPAAEPTVRGRGSEGVLWCAPGSQTYILISIASTVAAEDSLVLTLEHVLMGAASAVYDHIMAVGDGTILGGKFQWPQGEMSLNQLLFLKVWNANNHQITWGVMHATIAAIVSYMNSNGWGVGHFDIYDGGIRVGYGLFT